MLMRINCIMALAVEYMEGTAELGIQLSPSKLLWFCSFLFVFRLCIRIGKKDEGRVYMSFCKTGRCIGSTVIQSYGIESKKGTIYVVYYQVCP